MPLNGHYHLTGIAGVGMSALAEAILDQGFSVSGSDRHCDQGLDLEVIRCLKAQGVSVHKQDGSGVTPGTRALVVSTAIEQDNADMSAAQRLNVPIVHRAAMLAELARGKRVVAVTGTSGKSTVTAMIGWILEQAGRDPTVVNGAALVDWRQAGRLGSVRAGKSDLWVLEADESDRSLVCFDPDWVVITNVTKDHFDVDETRALFDAFAAKARVGVVDMSREGAAWEGFAPEVTGNLSSFEFRGIPFRIGLPGRHNAENALTAAVLCDRLQIPLRDVSAGLGSFRGVHRRLEVLGQANGITVIDDYAHNPAKVRAAWAAVAPYHRRTHCVWRPHGFGPLRKTMAELARTFADVAAGGGVFILPVYDAGGTADRSVNAVHLVAEIQAQGGTATAVCGFNDCAVRLAETASAGDAILVMGARDPGLPLFGRRLLEHLGA